MFARIINDDLVRGVLAILAMLIFLVLFVFVVFFDVPEQNQTLLNVLVGIFGTLITGIFGYYFGSSSGSKAKTKILDDELSQDDLQTSHPPDKP